jgi:two-component system cell cycle sensor histidine kinase/response regulator CckA
MIVECDRGARIGEALESAGYDVRYAHGAAVDRDVDLVVHVVRPRTGSGIMVRPLTDKAAIQPQLRHDERMEAIAHLAGGVAHDFNNILSVISICTDEVLDGMEPTDANRECLIDIRHAVDRGAALTRDLLSFSRRDVQEARLVDFNEIVVDAQRLVGRILGDDVDLHVTLGAKESQVRVDPGRWPSVFVNLAVNARQAMPNGGSMTIRTSNVELDPATRGRTRPRGNYVELEVSDTGCGIPTAVLPKIFDPFFSTKGCGKASGLGLSVVHGIVEQSGGWIEVTSRVDAGTTFRIYLPIAEDTHDAPAQSTTHPVVREGAKVLLVEDEEPVRRVAQKALERAGYEVFTAASAEDALALLPSIPAIDMLVTDVELPGIDGRRFSVVLAHRYPKLEILYTSGYTDDEVLRYGVSHAEMNFLHKPYTAKLLVTRVREIFAKAKAR